MISYKVCVSTSKYTGKIIASLTHVVETDEEPKDYTMENERYHFAYKFFKTEQEAKDYVKELEK